MLKSRREFLLQVGAGVAAVCTTAARAGEPSRRAAPFRLLYNNDTTNLLGCTSPWHPRGAPFHPRMIEASVAEAAAADVQLLAPGLGEVPWWPSKVLPLAVAPRATGAAALFLAAPRASAGYDETTARHLELSEETRATEFH